VTVNQRRLPDRLPATRRKSLLLISPLVWALADMAVSLWFWAGAGATSFREGSTDIYHYESNPLASSLLQAGWLSFAGAGIVWAAAIAAAILLLPGGAAPIAALAVTMGHATALAMYGTYGSYWLRPAIIVAAAWGFLWCYDRYVRGNARAAARSRLWLAAVPAVACVLDLALSPCFDTIIDTVWIETEGQMTLVIPAFRNPIALYLESVHTLALVAGVIVWIAAFSTAICLLPSRLSALVALAATMMHTYSAGDWLGDRIGGYTRIAALILFPLASVAFLAALRVAAPISPTPGRTPRPRCPRTPGCASGRT
jgi:hypothetical protein